MTLPFRPLPTLPFLMRSQRRPHTAIGGGGLEPSFDLQPSTTSAQPVAMEAPLATLLASLT